MGVAFTSPLILGQNPPSNLVSLVNSYSFFKSQLKSPKRAILPLSGFPPPLPQGRTCIVLLFFLRTGGHSITPHTAGYMGDSEEPAGLR